MEEKLFAGFWVRFFSGLLDLVFITPLVFILIYYLGNSDFQSFGFSNNFYNYKDFSVSTSNRFANYIAHTVSIIYLTYFVSTKSQATLGKRIMGIYVANRDGSKLTWQKSLARALASMLTSMTLGLGFLIVIFIKEKIALHDLICNTRVFHGKK
ncbi:MAG: RDD family protein [Rickettsiales bacterium]|nr:RDD family protein [Rickettsiales bacterium]